MSKKGVSAVRGNISPVVGEKTVYAIADWYPDTPESDRNPEKVTWELFKKRSNGNFTSTNIKKIGDSSFTFGESSTGHTYRLEAYLYNPEGGGLIITPQRNKIPQISKVELLYVDDTKGNEFSFLEKMRAKAHCINMFNKELVFTLWEDDAKGSGHNAQNQAIETKKARVDKNGVAAVDFMLTKALMQKAMKGETDVKQLEFYVTVEYYTNKKHATDNVNTNNPFPQQQKPSSTTPPPKAKNSPAAQKPQSKKEEKGIWDSVVDWWGELWDHGEAKGTATKDKEPTREKPDGRSVSTVGKTEPEKKEEKPCECKEKMLYWGKHFTCEERKKIFEISKRLDCDPNYLTSAMALETGGTFRPDIVNSLGYTGLIQIGATAAEDINRRKGTNITAGNNGNLKNMSKIEQLTYVEYYLEPYKGKLNTLADFYLAILMPVDCGKGNQRDYVVFDKNISLDYKDGKVIKNTKWVRQRAYAQNPVFHKEGKNEDGKTYVWEIAEEIEKQYERGKASIESSFSCQTDTTEDQNDDEKWHDPVDNPRLTKYNYSGIIKPSSATYGWCRRNSSGSKKYHSGVDFFAIPGKDKVYSCLKGNIHQVTYSDSAGWIVRVKIQNVKDLLEQEKKVNYTTRYADELKGIDIKETDSVYLIYMHLDSVVVTKQDATDKKEVKAGTLLGYAGVSGSIASGGKAPHLHLEIATVLDAYGKGESVRTNPARFVKLNSYDTKDQDEEAQKKHFYK
ncbi:MAG: M23 family metallopeptidase [Flavobacteriaceae bacterium]|jgi:murein DD-endopeptidase MepM/ murein hydrolase activator NlpD|nr:M23 family metallopeptidase [Flavobacteriaceae bacterium]